MNFHWIASEQPTGFVKVDTTQLTTYTSKRKYKKKQSFQPYHSRPPTPKLPDVVSVAPSATPSAATTPRSVLEAQPISVMASNVGKLMNHLVGAKYTETDLINVTQHNAMEYIYLVAVREFLKTEECTDCTYKIGRTDKPLHERLRAYGKGCFYVTTFAVGNNSRHIESKLLKAFMGQFKQQKKVGDEYFSGDPKLMIKVMNDVIYGFNSQHNSEKQVDHLQQQLDILQNKYVSLYNSLHSLTQSYAPVNVVNTVNARAKKSLNVK